MSQLDLPFRALAGREAAAPRSLGPAFAAVYLTFAALLLVDPQPVLDWLDDHDPSPVVSAARSTVAAVAAASSAIGLAQLSATLRSRAVPLFKRPEGRPS